MKKVLMMLSMVIVLFIAANVFADPIKYGFSNITGNSLVDAGIGESQLFVDVSTSTSYATFKFYNTGPKQSTITAVYFDDGALLGTYSIYDSGDGVLYAWIDPAKKVPNLPGGELVEPDFTTSVGFGAEPVPPPAQNGIDPGEWLELTFSKNGDVIDALNDFSLRIGIHVQNFESGGSESFINNPTPVSVPEPGILILLGLSMTAIGVAARFVRKI